MVSYDPELFIEFQIICLFFSLGNPSKTVVLDSLRGVIDSSPLGLLLKPFIEEDDVKEVAMMDYLHDFMHMVYKPILDNEFEVRTDGYQSIGSIYFVWPKLLF